MQNYTLEQKTQKTFECRYFPKQRLRWMALSDVSASEWHSGSQIRGAGFEPQDLGPMSWAPGFGP